MQIITDPADYQRTTLAWRGAGLRSAVVPTMGALHAGHLRLIEEARAHAARVSVTLFVNPMQFAPTEDLAKYPRTFEADAEACRARGVDILFAPDAAAIYPQAFHTFVTVEGLTSVMEGASRPVHFRGVTTIVMKLLMLAQADVAVFGWKDAQQVLVLRRMVEDLAVPVEMLGVETVREADGLALSSRNRYLTPEERAAAPALQAGLSVAAAAFAAGERNAGVLAGLVKMKVAESPLLRLDYAELRTLDTLAPLEQAQPGNTLLAAAMFVGRTRLIDNVRL